MSDLKELLKQQIEFNKKFAEEAKGKPPAESVKNKAPKKEWGQVKGN